MDLHPADVDLLDGPDYELPDIPTGTPPNDGMLHTPSPVSEENGQYSGAKIRYSAPEKVKHTAPLAKVPPAKVTRFRYDINISFRTPGQKMYPTKTPKTCVVQFCIMQDPQAYESMEFYKTTITKAKEELMKVTPFSALKRLQGPWLPEVKFVKPSFKYANTDSTCAYFATYPSKADIQFMMEPYIFGTEENAPHYKFFIIFDCDVSTKVQLQRIKEENTEPRTREACTETENNTAEQNLLDNANKAMNMMNSDIQKASSDWFSALVQYRDQKATSSNTDFTTIQPQQYNQALSVHDHFQPSIPAIIDNGKPNLQIHLKTGGREVFHTPDTTGTPQPAYAEEIFPITNTQHLMNPDYQPQLPPPMHQQQTPQMATALTPHMFFNMCLQQQQPQMQIQPQVQLLQPPQQLPMHQRLGPRTPPVDETPPPLPPKKRPHPLGPRDHRRNYLQPEHRQQRDQSQWRPHWERDSRHSQSDYHSHEEEEDERRRRQSRSRSISPTRSRERYHHRDPRIKPAPYRPRGKIRQTFPPSRNNKPPRHVQYGEYKKQQQQRQQETQPPPPPPDPAQFTEYAKILNVAPEQMCEAYQVIQKAQQRPC